jgi:hypothetical protein
MIGSVCRCRPVTRAKPGIQPGVGGQRLASVAGDENNWGTIANVGTPGAAGVTNHPDATDTYSVPQNLGYSVNGLERTRTNGQLTCSSAGGLGYRDADYTYSENKVLLAAQ